jgi:hypothetical protein
MLKTIKQCRDILVRNFDYIIQRRVKLQDASKNVSPLYTYESLERLTEFIEHPALRRALKVGIYNLWFPRMASIIEEVLSNGV